ncbi:MAG: division/cell wall cluster transcriptional repressor MraZ [Micropepsaceae bacterium]
MGARPFLSTFVNRVDAKGRISVPARYREVLDGQGSRSIFARASLTEAAIVAGGQAWMDGLQALIDAHDPSSPLYDDFAILLLGDTVELHLDSEGRVSFPAELMRHAGLDETAAFLGKGQCFEIWEPKALEIRKLQARRSAAENRGMLRINNGGGATQ